MMTQAATNVSCGECHTGCRLLVGYLLQWTLQCSNCGITEILSYDVARAISKAQECTEG